MPEVAELLCYPVKGCAATSVTRTTLTSTGLEHDRSFMVVSDEGVYRSQRRDPRLAVIRPAVGDGGERLTLEAPDAGTLEVRVDVRGPRRRVDLFGAASWGIDQGEAAARWLSELLGAHSRLVRVPLAGAFSYADSSALHALSLSSLRLLNTKLATPLPLDRFRPNIVIDGWDEPHTEDRARRVSVGETELLYVKPAIRCAVTMIEQTSGTKAGPEPLRTLAGYRRTARGTIAFGVKFGVLKPGAIAVGDEVRVDVWGEPEP
ncbi:MOSC domain-containing protein [Herbidospora daliensis]|uniref:MOSC domain-containing protein n=1 Tax=Herbidospora daliensis TaxID=295585 RepID=UPI000781FD7D|nr:MOSC N-terminal beta barrel domain-containing protein [Herbidospora daliensis]